MWTKPEVKRLQFGFSSTGTEIKCLHEVGMLNARANGSQSGERFWFCYRCIRRRILLPNWLREWNKRLSSPLIQ